MLPDWFLLNVLQGRLRSDAKAAVPLSYQNLHQQLLQSNLRSLKVVLTTVQPVQECKLLDKGVCLDAVPLLLSYTRSRRQQ